MLETLQMLIAVIMGGILFLGMPIYAIKGLIKPPKNQTRLKFFGKCLAIWFALLITTTIFVVVMDKYKPTPEQKQAQEQEKERIKSERYLENLKAEQERQAQKDREKNTSRAMLTSKCQTAIMPMLKNPKSFDVDVSRTEFGKDGDNRVMNMAFYATNSFNANILSIARCEFDENGNILKARLLEQ